MEREHTREDAAAAVRRMQDYIDLHLRTAITLSGLAREAGYSVWYAARMFRELTGQSPFEYIRRLRLSASALEIRDGTEKVLDVALDFLFDSHEGFTRSFTREFGVTPSAYRKKPGPIPLFTAYPVSLPHRNNGGSGMEMKAIFVQIIERPARKVLLKRARTARDYFAYCEEVGCEVWGVLSSVKEALYESAGFWLPPALRPSGTSEYVQGVELPEDWNGTIPAGFELVAFPPATLMVFQGEPYDDNDFMEEVGNVMEKIGRFDPKPYGYLWAPEAAPRFQLEPQGWRGYIEARPVRKA